MKLPVLKIAALAMVTTVTGCGGGSDSEPAKALDLAKALLSKTDAAWATSVPTPSGVAALRDGCYVADGYNRTTATAAAETKLADYTASNAYRVGSKRQNVTVLSDDTTLNADKTERRLIKVRYSIAFADGSVDNKVEDTLVVGSSSGECATQQSGAEARYWGNRRIVDVSLNSRVARYQNHSIATGEPIAINNGAGPVSYRREVQFGIEDPAGAAAYVVVTGPGYAYTLDGVAHPFSVKLLSPRILRAAPELAGKRGNFLNWADTDSFKFCRPMTGHPATLTTPASRMDCAGAGAGGNAFGWTLTASEVYPEGIAAADKGFADLGFVAGANYSFAVYNDDGWKTGNGHLGKTPVATYTVELESLPPSFTEMAVGRGASNNVFADKFPHFSFSDSEIQGLAANLLEQRVFSQAGRWSEPASTVPAVYRASGFHSYAEGSAASNVRGVTWPMYRMINPQALKPGDTQALFALGLKPDGMAEFSYGEFGVNYSDRNHGNLLSYLAFY